MPSRIMPKGVSSVKSSPWALTIRTWQPIRQFLSMIAPSMCVPQPKPSGGRPLPCRRQSHPELRRSRCPSGSSCGWSHCGRSGSGGRRCCFRSPPLASIRSHRRPDCRGRWHGRSTTAARTGGDCRSARRQRPDRTSVPRRQLQAGLVKRLDRADVFPIAVKQVDLNVMGADRGRKDLLAEVAVVGLLQHLEACSRLNR